MSVPEEKSTPAKTHDELKLPDCLDTSLFRTHLINADKEWSAVKCDTCAVSAYDYTVGGCHMLYCPACRHYSCEDCCVEDYDRKSKNSTYYCSHCNKPIFDITGPRTYECLGEWPLAYLKIVWHWLSVWWSQFHFTVARIYLIRMTSSKFWRMSLKSARARLESVCIERQLLTGYHVCV